MALGLIRRALRRTLREVRHVRAVPHARATGLVAEVYAQVEREFGMLAPPIGLHSAAPEVLAAGWVMLRESLIAGGLVSRADKELVATAVSAANSCPYCAEVHGATLGALGRPEVAAAITADRPDAIADAEVRALAQWARGDGPLPERLSTSFEAELAAVAVTFNYFNRMVSVFLGRSPLPATLPDVVRDRALVVLGRFMRPGAAPEPGDTLDLLPATGTQPPAWARPGSVLAEAFSRAEGAIVAAAAEVVPPAVRVLLARELARWDGRPPGLGRGWVEEAIAGIAEPHRPAARFALLIAKAAYQIDDAVTDDVRAAGFDGKGLVELAAWAALAGAGRQVVAQRERLWPYPAKVS
jgi:AhpD family alkylhydroperoxidase